MFSFSFPFSVQNVTAENAEQTFFSLSFYSGMHFCQQVLYWAVQFDLPVSRWHLCVKAGCNQNGWVYTWTFFTERNSLLPQAMSCFVGETYCCLRQWTDTWRAQWSELPPQPQGVRAQDGQSQTWHVYLQVPWWQAQAPSLKENPTGSPQVPRGVPRHGAEKPPKPQILCTGIGDGLNS